MKKIYKGTSVFIVSIFFISNLSISASNAVTGNLPAPVIGTAQGFYPNKEYLAIGGAGSVALEAGESLLEVALYVQLLPKGSVVGAQCNATSGTRLTFAAKTTSALNLGLLSAKWTNPSDSVNQVVCALYQATTSKGIFSSPASYALIGADPNASVTPAASPTASVTPTASPTASKSKTPTASPTASKSKSPTATASASASTSPTVTEEESTQPTPEATPVASSALSMSAILGVLGALAIALLIVIIVLLLRKKK